MIILKFGNAVLTDSDSVERIVSIVRSKLEQKPVIVASAFAGVADMLSDIANSAAWLSDNDFPENIEALRQRHILLATDAIAEGEMRDAAVNDINDLCAELQAFADAVNVVGEITDRSRAAILSFGEKLSTVVIRSAIAAAGIDAALIDASEIIYTNGSCLEATADLAEIANVAPETINEIAGGCDVVITQGFIGNCEDRITRFGKGGCEHTAAILGTVLQASEIDIFTDVDGIQTADPTRIAETRTIARLSFEEATEMAHFGSKILNPSSIECAILSGVPVRILNANKPTGEGTLILPGSEIADGVKSISFKENILMLNIYSTRMIEVSGFLARVFDVFARHGVSVDLISTSEANISLTMDSSRTIDPVVAELSEIADVKVATDKAQISVIGKNVVRQHSLLMWILSSLAHNPIYMVSQGASSVNISYVVDRAALDAVLQELHTNLFE